MNAVEIAKHNPLPHKVQVDGTVRFILIKPDAHEVSVAGSFNNWNPCTTPMVDLGHGRFIRDLQLPVGRYEYQFVVDGRWLHDRTAKESVENPFGGINSVIRVRRFPSG